MKMLNPLIKLTITDQKGNIVQTVRSRKRRRISHIIQKDKFTGCLFAIKVTYQNNLQNETSFATRKETIKTLIIFLEK